MVVRKSQSGGIIRVGESFSRKSGHDPERTVYDCGPDKKDNERKGPADSEHEMAEVGASATEHLYQPTEELGPTKNRFHPKRILRDYINHRASRSRGAGLNLCKAVLIRG